MAITDIAGYTHLNATDIERLAAELDAIRCDIEDSLGAPDAAYIRRTIRFQRLLEVIGRLLILDSRSKVGWVLGTAALAFAKTVENMEIGHNVSHGQWDWMNDPEIHSATWEWDMVAPASQWRYSHNYRHHVFSNVIGVDDDLGFGVMRVTRDQRWKPQYLLQPLQNVLLALLFEWGIALHSVDMERIKTATGSEKTAQAKVLMNKVVRQTVKDYLVFPALSMSRWRRALGANVIANLLRNTWAYVVIFCGHFPDGAHKFTPDVLEQESKPEWYLRQMLGAANFKAGPLMALASGNLCYQIEHHLFPDLPSNRYAEIAERVRPLCEKYALPYTTGSLARQYLSTLRTIHRLALPDRFVGATSDDVPDRGRHVARRHRASRHRAAKRRGLAANSARFTVARRAA